MSDQGTELKCAKCGSTKVVPRARVIDRGDGSMDIGNVRLGVARKPEAWLFKGEEREDVYARLCGACGFAELYVEDPDLVYQAYLDSQRS